MPTLLARKPITVIRPLDHLNAATSGEFGRQLTTAISAPGGCRGTGRFCRSNIYGQGRFDGFGFGSRAGEKNGAPV